MSSNVGLIFKKAPEHLPVIGEHLELQTREIDLDAGPPEAGQLVKNLYISFDPYTRGCMREPDNATWAPPFIPGNPIVCGALSRVLKSAVTDYEAGDIVWGMFGAEEYTSVPSFLMPYVRKLSVPAGADPVLFTGALGTAGLSAYGSFYGIAKPQPGQTIFISAASGGVGQIVGQLAKLEGFKVIGSVGSDEKLDFILNELNFDAGFNYRKEVPLDALERLAPDGFDIYFDNVGGETLDAALVVIKDFGRIVSCGMISQYNLPIGEKYGVQNLMNIFLKRLTIQGFIASDPQFLGEHAMEFFTKMPLLLGQGKIKTKESVTVGMQNAPAAYLGMFTGENFGKTVLKVDDEQ